MIPRFCPRPSCRYHHREKPPPGWYLSAGYYHTKAFGTIPRYRCRLCGKYFSSQTFSIDYYSKRTVPYRKLIRHLITTSSIRDMARDFSVSVDVVLNKLERLARNSLLTLELMCTELSLSENLVTDGFESFTVSQFFPCHINLLAGRATQLLYAFDYVTLRRKGRMTAEQKRMRDELERVFRADPKGVERSMVQVFEAAARLIQEGSKAAVTIYSDKHHAYSRAMKRCEAMQQLVGAGRAAHKRIDSRRARTRSNPLFAVNYLDRQIRKDMCEHVRETVCFGRNVNRAMDRMAIYGVHHDLMKPYREAKGIKRTHAEMAGMSREAVRKVLSGLFTRRAFATRVSLSPLRKRIWNRGYVTPLSTHVERVPKHAMA